MNYQNLPKDSTGKHKSFRSLLKVALKRIKLNKTAQCNYVGATKLLYSLVFGVLDNAWTTGIEQYTFSVIYHSLEYKVILIQYSRSWDSEGLWPGFDLRQCKIFPFSTVSRSIPGPSPASCPVGTWALSPGAKRHGSATDNSPPSTAKVKKGGAIIPLPHIFIG
jgi:hypothetical protein